ncbi:GNAT family N-acetyltransferase [Candidatus Eisenbacteria bacterium]|uniref:GNAT family N-acetyltransferase n=1 Tax=Eiseniibacteriota bacterium TaxID=2212470 RepID=A0ABV6YM40_UNCEI
MDFRELTRDEVTSIWKIDRAEVVRGIYHLEGGGLVLKSEFFDAKGWPPGEEDQYGPVLLDCFDRGGTFHAAFDGDKLAATAVLESRFIGSRQDQLQLVFMHVDKKYRGTGLGGSLFKQAVQTARRKGARQLYISATPSENTIDFYRHLGCVVATEIDKELFKLEPEDIHLEYRLNQRLILIRRMLCG